MTHEGAQGPPKGEAKGEGGGKGGAGAAGKGHRCERCGKRFATRNDLKKHVRVHTGERPYECGECGARFTQGGGLKNHALSRHGGAGLPAPPGGTDAPSPVFACSHCGKVFLIKGHLLQHLRTHLREKPHRCDDCGAAFAQKSQLTVHARTHSGERPYRCRVCRRAFAHSTALKMHVRRHTGEKPFKCLLCPAPGAAFVQLPHLKKHMLCIHKTAKPYLCVRCRDFFKTKAELEAHRCTAPAADDPDDPNAVDAGDTVEGKGSSAAEDDGRPPGMALERMRLLLAVLLKRISTPARLDALRFGRRLIDDVLRDSIEGSGREPCGDERLPPAERLRRNVQILLDWTVPKHYMDKFRRERRSTDDLLEELTS